MTIPETAASACPNAPCHIPYIEHFPELDRPPQRIQLAPLPFQIGRQKPAHFVIHSQWVSNIHAEIAQAGDDFVLIDHSANGTFVNRKRIQQARLQPNDVIHISHKQLRFRLEPAELPGSSREATAAEAQSFADSLSRGWETLKEVIRDQQVQAHFEPIVRLATEEIVGFELLSRVMNQGLGSSPAASLSLADQFEIAPDLSRMFRAVGLQSAAQIPGHVSFFFNLHPSEKLGFSLADSLCAAAAAFRAQGRDLVVEIHDDASADGCTLRQLRDHLRRLDIGLAFDDFGAGQTQLDKLAEIAPDLVKIDMQLIRGIDQSTSQQDQVGRLAEFARALKIGIVAEGVETSAEANACRALGCVYAQGFLFGRPAPAASYINPTAASTRLILDPDLQASVRGLRP